MKITHLECFRLDMPLSEPYTIAYETVSQAHNLILKLTTDQGLTGWGCAAPDLAVTGEAPEDVLTVADTLIRDRLLGASPFHIARIIHDLKTALPKSASALAMADMALYDLLARRADIPLYQLLGGFKEKIPTSITIGILSLEQTLEAAARYLRAGFSILKLKGGKDHEADVEKVLKLRERFGQGFALRFDANQGYTYEASVRFLEQVASADLEIMEQPTCQGVDERLGRVTRAATVPVMADESIKTLKDAFHLARNDRMDMINIKLMKMGGIFSSLHINSVAKAAGLEVMVGCLDESALGISAGLHFALSRANIEFADLDGHLDLLNDPFSGLFTLRQGILYPTDAPGLGRINL